VKPPSTPQLPVELPEVVVAIAPSALPDPPDVGVLP
jgi:hypothetical protein